MTKIKKEAAYRIHVICWVIFILYEAIIIGIVAGRFNKIGFYIGFYALNICLFYVQAYFILPLGLSNKKYRYWTIPFLIVAAFLLYLFISMIIDFTLSPLKLNEWKANFPYTTPVILRTIYRFLYFIGFGTGYYYLITYMQAKAVVEQQEREKLLAIIEKQSIENELSMSQNALVKAQINPHFLFNTLNFLYTSNRRTAPETSEAIMALSQIMRFSIDSSDHWEPPAILLEIEQVKNLIYLHQIRKGNTLNIQLNYNAENLSGIKVISLVLITLVENIFKHGNLSTPENQALIAVYKDAIGLHIKTQNAKYEVERHGHHLGLENVRKRLALAYVEKASLKTYSDENNLFHTHVWIQ